MKKCLVEEEESEEEDIFIKIVVLGDISVGKTSLLNQYCFKKFDSNVGPTIGCDFFKKIKKNYSKKKRNVKLQFWDIAGKILNQKSIYFCNCNKS